ncbi:MAG: hypothetical protein E7631_00720 [Ruminococcaceae bacterium]|nr:hypothetical protein [Oscillospiraceae bacterium]
MKYFRKCFLCVLLTAGLWLTGCGGTPAAEETEAAETTPRAYLDPADRDTILRINPANKLGVIDNKLSNMNMWNYNMFWKDSFSKSFFKNMYPFVEEMQFMTATGGELSRDLFRDPSDRSVLDDYDFTPLVNACRHVVEQGLVPVIKTGNIPQKYSTVSTTGTFGVNLYPPDDYNVYYNYIRAMTQTLADTFGTEEVQTWRWGCFTEYENGDWFQGTCEDYCKIYDYTVAAIQSVLGEDIRIGAHSMSCSEGLWDERDFIEHCISGTNYCTGQQGTRLTYLAASYYDDKISGLSSRTTRLTKTINILRDKVNQSVDAALAAGISREHLDELGITSIYYGVDEGRILSGSKGLNDSALTNRIVGDTKQAAYDAMILQQMVENDIGYFSAWAYHTDQFYGLPTVSYHVAAEFYKMVGTTQVETAVERYVENSLFPRTQDALASVGEDGTIYAMIYDFGDDLNVRDRDKNVGNALHLLVNLDCTRAKLTFSYINDESNFFDEWRADCEAAGITRDDFSWSPDSTQLPGNLTTDKAVRLFNQNISAGSDYTLCSVLKMDSAEVDVVDGELYYHLPLEPNSVVFCKIEPLQ